MEPEELQKQPEKYSSLACLDVLLSECWANLLVAIRSGRKVLVINCYQVLSSVNRFRKIELLKVFFV